MSCKVSKGTLTPPITVFECNKIRNILFKYSPMLKENKLLNGSRESLNFDLIFHDYSDYNEILDRSIPDPKEREELRRFLRTKNLREINIRDTTCISFLFSRDHFLIWYMFQELVFHTPELQPYGETDPSPTKCRLAPTDQLHSKKKMIILTEQLDSSWLFIVGRSHNGPPS